MRHVAGNQTDARIKAENAYKNAQRAGVKGHDLEILKAAYEAAKAVEQSAIKSAGHRGLF